MPDKKSTAEIVIGDGAAAKARTYIETGLHAVRPLVLCDVNTERYAVDCFGGFERFLWPDRQHATPEAAALAMKKIEEMKADLLIACGSGSLHDLTRYAAEKAAIPYLSFPTAPSVDGFASSMAAMTVNGQKLTLPAHAPVALFAEPAVFRDAPVRLTLSGIGDILGKYVCLFDWKTASLLTGERFDPVIEKMERDAVDTLMHTDFNAPGFPVKLMECLVLSGVAIQQFGNTRPASGAEHHLSHFWEMHCLNAPTDALHGEQVGTATIQLLRRYREVTSLRLTKKPLTREYLLPVFGELTDRIIRENTPFLPDAISQEKLDSVWDEIRRLALSELPDASVIEEYLASKGGKTSLAALGLPDDDAFSAATLQYAPYVRNRLTLLKLL